jgi:hypothetical protein
VPLEDTPFWNLCSQSGCFIALALLFVVFVVCGFCGVCGVCGFCDFCGICGVCGFCGTTTMTTPLLHSRNLSQEGTRLVQPPTPSNTIRRRWKRE